MSVEAEMSVIGGAMLDKECARTAVDALYPEMFSREVLQEIFRKMTDMYWQGKSIDGVLLIQELPERKETILKLANYVPALSHFEEYIRIVQDDWQIQKLQDSLLKLGTDLCSADETLEKLRELTEEHTKLLQCRSQQNIKSFGDVARELEAWLRDRERSETVRSGLTFLDSATGGFMRSTVFALAARPGSGKTDFALNLALRMGKRGAKVLYFSMEMTNLQLMQRAASSLLRINGERIRDKDLTEEELRGMEKVLQNFANAGRISFVQEPRISVKRVRHFVDLWKPDVVFVDHLGLMARPAYKDAFKALGEVSNQLKQLALEKKIALVELVQMNRQIESRASKKPSLTDLRESGDIEQDCDYVGFLIPEDLKGKNLSGDAWADVELYLEKNRHGRPGIFKYRWQPQYHSFSEVETRYG